MYIDNSRAQSFRLCPWFYFESYLRNGTGVQPVPKTGEGYSSLEFGSRVHRILEGHYKKIQSYKYYEPYEPHANETLEAEAQWLVNAYCEHYPADNWEIIDVEKTFKLRLPGSHHVYMGKLDLLIRDLDDVLLWIIDHKTEQRGSKSHIPQKLAVTDQGSLYLWAARKIYGDDTIGMKYNILTRSSEKGLKPPSFQDRYVIERSQHEINTAVRDIIYVADQIEAATKAFGEGEWPANRDECYGWGYCDYYQLHRFGEDPQLALKHKFQTREEYLSVEGVDIIE